MISPGIRTGVVLVDSSVWIEFLNGRVRFTEDDLPHLATCGPVLQEVLQGLKQAPASAAFRESLLAFPVLGDPVALPTFEHAARIFRAGRAKGYTIRSGVDCLIAAIAIESQAPVWHRDRDFDRIAKFTALEVVSPKAADR